MALTGAFLFCVAFIVPGWFIYQYEKAAINLIVMMKINSLELEAISSEIKETYEAAEVLAKDYKTDIDSLKEIMSMLKNGEITTLKSYELIREDREVVKKLQNSIREKFINIRKNNTAYHIKKEQIDGKIKEVELLSKLISRWYWVGSILILIGTFMCSFGFYFWYKLVQLPNDKKLKSEIPLRLSLPKRIK